MQKKKKNFETLFMTKFTFKYYKKTKIKINVKNNRSL